MTITYPIGKNLYVNVTNRCSNRCDFCIRKYGDTMNGSGSLWLEREPTVEEILADIKKHDLAAYRELVFCGYGEPLERLDDVVAVLRGVKSFSGIKTRINTNGQADLIHGRPTAKDLKGLVDTVSISLNASDAAAYDKICHSKYGEAAFGAMLAYAADCKNYVPSVVLSIVDVIPPEEIEACRAVANKIGVTLRVRKMEKEH